MHAQGNPQIRKCIMPLTSTSAQHIQQRQPPSRFASTFPSSRRLFIPLPPHLSSPDSISANASTTATTSAIAPAERNLATPSGAECSASGFLQWLVAERGALPAQPLLEIALDDGDGRGRRLIAAADVAPGDVLLSLPLSSCFVDDEGDDPELPWSARMALSLLAQRQHARQPQSEGEAQHWGPWLAALPTHVDLPFLHWSDSEIAALADVSAVQETRAMRQLFEDSFEVLQEEIAALGCGRLEWGWALAILHSRCFLEGPAATHMIAPGIDMANHAFEPNATVRCRYNPDACQGVHASEDVCELGILEPSRFELLALSDGPGIRQGDEVTISYGRWPNDAFLLFFGFVPDPNPHDTIVLFEDLASLVGYALESEGALDEKVDDVIERMMQRLPAGDYRRLLVTMEGFDGRLMQALATLQATCPWLPASAAGKILLSRCWAVRKSLHGVNVIGEGSRLGEGWPMGGDSASIFRESKQRILSQAIASLSVPTSGLQGK